MNEHLEDALDTFLSGDKSDKRNIRVGKYGIERTSPCARSTRAVENQSLKESQPESKIWKLIDKWKAQGLSPKFEICAEMLKLWGVDT